MTYGTANEAKASFDSLYTTPTPHNYFAAMARHGYAIGEEAKPYFQSAIRLLRERIGDARPIQVLDLGCSYGVGAALLKHQLSFYDMLDFFTNGAPEEYGRCVDSTRSWLKAHSNGSGIRCIGTDSSKAAIRFAAEAGLIDGGIPRDFEKREQPTPEEIRLIQGSDVLMSTGAIGYVGEKTFSVLLEHLGTARPAQPGPFAVFTILRMFDPAPIRATFERFGFEFGIVPSIHLRQRRFTDKGEREETLSLLESRGVSPGGLEEEGVLYADLYVAARPEWFMKLRSCVGGTRIRRSAHVSPSDFYGTA